MNPKAYQRHKTTKTAPPSVAQLALRGWINGTPQCQGCWRCAPERFAKPGRDGRSAAK